MGEHLKQALHDHAEYSYRMYKVQGSKKDERQRGGSTASASEEEKQHVSVISFDDDEEKARLQRKKRTQEDMVEDFVKLLEKMMNPRQALTSIISAAMGLASIIVGIFYFHSFLPDTATKAIELDKLLIAYASFRPLVLHRLHADFGGRLSRHQGRRAHRRGRPHRRRLHLPHGCRLYCRNRWLLQDDLRGERGGVHRDDERVILSATSLRDSRRHLRPPHRHDHPQVLLLQVEEERPHNVTSSDKNTTTTPTT